MLFWVSSQRLLRSVILSPFSALGTEITPCSYIFELRQDADYQGGTT